MLEPIPLRPACIAPSCFTTGICAADTNTRQDSAVGVNPMMHYKLVSVRPLEYLRLAVRFADGLSGNVVLKESHLYAVFEALKDTRLFAEVHCRQGFVEWPGEIDIAPDAMYDEIKASGI
jgi:hypothetical protein